MISECQPVANFDMGPEYENKRGRIYPEAGTIAEVLSENSYNNYALGKWHLSPSHQVTPAGPYENWPLGKGFDRFYGFLEDSGDQYKKIIRITVRLMYLRRKTIISLRI